MKDIVIVEDSRLIRKKIKDTLKDLGYNPVAEFSRGEDLFPFLDSKKPDLIIMDINLAGDLNGLETAHQIMKTEELPIIFLTGSEKKLKLKEPTLSTTTAYISKPFTSEELRINIELILYKKKMLNKIKSTNEEQRVLLDNIQNQVWYLVDPYTYGRVNRSHAEFFGYKREEMEHKKIVELFPDDVADRVIEHSKKVFNEKEQIEVEEEFTDYRGEKRLLYVTKTPYLDENGEVEYVVCSGEDITGKRKMQKELLEREQRFLSIVATLPDILMLFNKDGEYLNIWTGHEENLTKRRQEMLGQKLEDVLPSDKAQLIKRNLEKVLRENKLQIFEYELDVISGHKYFEARMTAISHNKAVMVARDITKRKKASAELEVQKAYFKQLFDKSPDAIAILDTDDRIINVNRSFEKLFGYKEE
ncbi:MAG: PAS domain S-box protein, partial [bacterium]